MSNSTVTIELKEAALTISTTTVTVDLAATGPQGPEGGTSTLTTKGDILGRSATAIARIPVGTDGQMLTADSSNPLGVAWTTPNPGDITGVTVSAPITGGGTSGTVNIGIDTGSGLTTSAGSLVVDSTLVPFLASANVFTNVQQITIPSASTKGLVIKAATGQSVYLLEIQNSSGIAVAGFNSAGSLVASSSYISVAGDARFIPSSSTVVPLTVRGAASQTADLQQWQNSAGTGLVRVSSSGSIISTQGAFLPSVSNVSSGSNALLTLRDAGTLVSVGVATNVALSVRGAASQTASLQEWQDSTGTMIARVSAAGTFISTTGGMLSPNLRNTADTGSYLVMSSDVVTVLQRVAGTLAFVVKGAASQTANLQEWQNSAGTALSFVDAFGGIRTNAYLQVHAGTASTKGLYVRGAASQTANLQEWQDSTGTILGRISASGSFLTSGRISIGQTSTATGQLNVTATLGGLIGAIVQGAASQSADLQQWQDSTGTVLAGVTSDGNIYKGSTTPGGTLGITIAAAANRGIVVRGAASQTANLQEWQDSAGTVLAYVTSTGLVRAPNGVVAGASNLSATLSVSALNASTWGIIIRGAASQTADLQQWQNSSATVLGKFNATGNMVIGNMGIATSSVATLHLSNGTAPTANPTGGGVLYAEGGALKWRGSSGTVTTIANA